MLSALKVELEVVLLEVVTWPTMHKGHLGTVWVTLWDPQTTFLVLHGEPESMFFEADF